MRAKIWRIIPFIFLSVIVNDGLAQDTNKPLSFYEIIWKRNLFRPLVKRPEPEIRPEVKPEVKQERKENIERKDLSLKAVIFSDGVYEAGIEDKTTGRFSYFREGDLIEGVKVVTIIEDRVVLDYEGQKMVLILR